MVFKGLPLLSDHERVPGSPEIPHCAGDEDSEQRQGGHRGLF